ncbi:hypothetical protein CcCBS67573_g04885 [Chytriomyces confervae]|uniref:C3H1-type domain-containing protein n=1 Tax=Chytriomyces confervae TaxID=246404 RepID=A0A507FEX6_9FUNG|nr:hypothetical protein CcCBS67573_g04885 [Chytriomyces confervae]
MPTIEELSNHSDTESEIENVEREDTKNEHRETAEDEQQNSVSDIESTPAAAQIRQSNEQMSARASEYDSDSYHDLNQDVSGYESDSESMPGLVERPSQQSKEHSGLGESNASNPSSSLSQDEPNQHTPSLSPPTTLKRSESVTDARACCGTALLHVLHLCKIPRLEQLRSLLRLRKSLTASNLVEHRNMQDAELRLMDNKATMSACQLREEEAAIDDCWERIDDIESQLKKISADLKDADAQFVKDVKRAHERLQRMYGRRKNGSFFPDGVGTAGKDAKRGESARFYQQNGGSRHNHSTESASSNTVALNEIDRAFTTLLNVKNRRKYLVFGDDAVFESSRRTPKYAHKDDLEVRAKDVKREEPIWTLMKRQRTDGVQKYRTNTYRTQRVIVLEYPNQPTCPEISVSDLPKGRMITCTWAVSLAEDREIRNCEVSMRANGGLWKPIWTGEGLRCTVIVEDYGLLSFRVRAENELGWGVYSVYRDINIREWKPISKSGVSSKQPRPKLSVNGSSDVEIALDSLKKSIWHITNSNSDLVVRLHHLTELMGTLPAVTQHNQDLPVLSKHLGSVIQAMELENRKATKQMAAQWRSKLNKMIAEILKTADVPFVDSSTTWNPASKLSDMLEKYASRSEDAASLPALTAQSKNQILQAVSALHAKRPAKLKPVATNHVKNHKTAFAQPVIITPGLAALCKIEHVLQAYTKAADCGLLNGSTDMKEWRVSVSRTVEMALEREQIHAEEVLRMERMRVDAEVRLANERSRKNLEAAENEAKLRLAAEEKERILSEEQIRREEAERREAGVREAIQQKHELERALEEKRMRSIQDARNMRDAMINQMDVVRHDNDPAHPVMASRGDARIQEVCGPIAHSEEHRILKEFQIQLTPSTSLLIKRIPHNKPSTESLALAAEAEKLDPNRETAFSGPFSARSSRRGRNKTVKCPFYATRKGCRTGESCSMIHEAAVSNVSNAGVMVDKNIDIAGDGVGNDVAGTETVLARRSGSLLKAAQGNTKAKKAGKEEAERLSHKVKLRNGIPSFVSMASLSSVLASTTSERNVTLSSVCSAVRLIDTAGDSKDSNDDTGKSPLFHPHSVAALERTLLALAVQSPNALTSVGSGLVVLSCPYKGSDSYVHTLAMSAVNKVSHHINHTHFLHVTPEMLFPRMTGFEVVSSPPILPASPSDGPFSMIGVSSGGRRKATASSGFPAILEMSNASNGSSKELDRDYPNVPYPWHIPYVSSSNPRSSQALMQPRIQSDFPRSDAHEQVHIIFAAFFETLAKQLDGKPCFVYFEDLLDVIAPSFSTESDLDEQELVNSFSFALKAARTKSPIVVLTAATPTTHRKLTSHPSSKEKSNPLASIMKVLERSDGPNGGTSPSAPQKLAKPVKFTTTLESYFGPQTIPVLPPIHAGPKAVAAFHAHMKKGLNIQRRKINLRELTLLLPSLLGSSERAKEVLDEDLGVIANWKLLEERVLSANEIEQTLLYAAGAANREIAGRAADMADPDLRDGMATFEEGLKALKATRAGAEFAGVFANPSDHSTLTNYESEILKSCLIKPNDLATSFKSVGGLEKTKQVIDDLIRLPLMKPDLFSYGVLKQSTTGLLLFGPPGTGKTLLAKSIAAESGANFLNIQQSNIQSKWVGENEKNVKAIFSLARKLKPCVIFVDEIDALLRTRSHGAPHWVTNTINEWMTEWDGINSKGSDGIIVVGATNRPFDLDEAVLRRLPRRLFVGLPTREERIEILKLILSEETLETPPTSAPEDDLISYVADKTEGFSGSDLKNICIAGALVSVRRMMSLNSGATNTPGAKPSHVRRVLRLSDFKEAFESGDVVPSLSEKAELMKELVKWDKLYGMSASGMRKGVSDWGF